jgi:hypothetical protein
MIKKFKKYIKENLDLDIQPFTFSGLSKEFQKTIRNGEYYPYGIFIDFENKLKELMIGKLVSFPCALDQNYEKRVSCIIKDVKVNDDSQIVITDDKGIRYLGRYGGNPGEDLKVYVSNGKKIIKLMNPDIDPYDEEEWGYRFESTELDPYGEENWNEEENIWNPYYDDDNYFDRMEMRGSECRMCGAYTPNILMTNGICNFCREDCRCIHCGQFNRPDDLIRGWCEDCRDEKDMPSDKN